MSRIKTLGGEGILRGGREGRRERRGERGEEGEGEREKEKRTILWTLLHVAVHVHGT